LTPKTISGRSFGNIAKFRFFQTVVIGKNDYAKKDVFVDLVTVGGGLDAALLRRAAKQLTEEGVSHVLATVDATQERELATKYDVRSVHLRSQEDQC
jgi:hypothetical protein